MGLFSNRAIIGASAAGAYEIEKSLRFNNNDSAYLSRDQGTPTNAKKFTLSTWFKLSEDLTDIQILGYGPSGNPWYTVGLNTDNEFAIAARNSSGTDVLKVDTTARLRDISAWYHVVVKVDTTLDDSNETNARAKIYINGVSQHGTYSQYTTVSDADTVINEARTAALFGAYRTTEQHFDGYIAETHFIDGQALEATSFGETNEDTGQWVPKKFAGSYGNNGFYLNFSDNSNTTATTLGKDSSGNGNNWTPNNFSVASGDGNDSKTDTPTSNKATISSLTNFTEDATLTDGNLKLSGSAGFKNISTIGFIGTSKFYYESVRTSAGGWQLLGVFRGVTNNPSNAVLHSQIYGFASTAAIYDGGSYSASGAPSWGNDDVMGVKYNNGTLQIYKNGTLNGTSITGIPTNEIIFAYIANDNTSSTSYMRFSSGDWTQATAASVDATWELSQANLPDPTIKLPTDHFNTVLYTGNNNTSQNITGVGFQPDLVWVKNRDNVERHHWVDSVRGDNKMLHSEGTYAERTGSYGGGHTQLNLASDGFNLVSNGNNDELNFGTRTYVAWNWKESATAGFDIVSYTGDGNSPRNVAHNLGVAPDVVIVKRRNDTEDWIVGVGPILGSGEEGHYLKLNTDAVKATGSGPFADTNSTSSNIVLGSNVATNGNSSTYIAYCFSSVEGYSKFGSYTGNANSDGPFVYTGFKPAMVFGKDISGADNWWIFDNKRSTSNVVDDRIFPSLTNVEGAVAADSLDFLSNGFKIRGSGNFMNESGNTFIYLAFAERPFKYANAR